MNTNRFHEILGTRVNFMSQLHNALVFKTSLCSRRSSLAGGSITRNTSRVSISDPLCLSSAYLDHRLTSLAQRANDHTALYSPSSRILLNSRPWVSTCSKTGSIGSSEEAAHTGDKTQRGEFKATVRLRHRPHRTGHTHHSELP